MCGADFFTTQPGPKLLTTTDKYKIFHCDLCNKTWAELITHKRGKNEQRCRDPRSGR